MSPGDGGGREDEGLRRNALVSKARDEGREKRQKGRRMGLCDGRAGKGVRQRNGAGYGARGGCVVTLLGDEANMHALDPAKVHLDRIALHYAVLQWCSISYEETG